MAMAFPDLRAPAPNIRSIADIVHANDDRKNKRSNELAQLAQRDRSLGQADRRLGQVDRQFEAETANAVRADESQRKALQQQTALGWLQGIAQMPEGEQRSQAIATLLSRPEAGQIWSPEELQQAQQSIPKLVASNDTLFPLIGGMGGEIPQAPQETFGTTPQTVMRDGQPVVGQFSNQGNFRQAEGLQPAQQAPKPVKHSNIEFGTIGDRRVAVGINPETGQREIIPDAEGLEGFQPTATRENPRQEKAAVEAQAKLTSLDTFRDAVDSLEQAFNEAKGITIGPGPQTFLPDLDGTRGKLEAAISLVAPMLRKLTRIPGEGSMSDFEAKLEQAKLPEPSDREDVIAFKIDNIRKLESGIRQEQLNILGQTGRSAREIGGDDEQPAGSGRVLDFSELGEG